MVCYVPSERIRAVALFNYKFKKKYTFIIFRYSIKCKINCPIFYVAIDIGLSHDAMKKAKHCLITKK